MKNYRQLARLASSVVLSLVTVIAMTVPSSATGNIVKADLAGAWQMTIIGQTGCGLGTTLYTFTLNGSGSSSNVTGTYHTAGCGDGTSSLKHLERQGKSITSWEIALADRSVRSFLPERTATRDEATALKQFGTLSRCAKRAFYQARGG